MELDKMDEYHPSSKPKMKATYFAYLQNNPGAKKAVHECVKETEEKEEKEKKEKDERKKVFILVCWNLYMIIHCYASG